MGASAPRAHAHVAHSSSARTRARLAGVPGGQLHGDNARCGRAHVRCDAEFVHTPRARRRTDGTNVPQSARALAATATLLPLLIVIHTVHGAPGTAPALGIRGIRAAAATMATHQPLNSTSPSPAVAVAAAAAPAASATSTPATAELTRSATTADTMTTRATATVATTRHGWTRASAAATQPGAAPFAQFITAAKATPPPTTTTTSSTTATETGSVDALGRLWSPCFSDEDCALGFKRDDCMHAFCEAASCSPRSRCLTSRATVCPCPLLPPPAHPGRTTDARASRGARTLASFVPRPQGMTMPRAGARRVQLRSC